MYSTILNLRIATARLTTHRSPTHEKPNSLTTTTSVCTLLRHRHHRRFGIFAHVTRGTDLQVTSLAFHLGRGKHSKHILASQNILWQLCPLGPGLLASMRRPLICNQIDIFSTVYGCRWYRRLELILAIEPVATAYTHLFRHDEWLCDTKFSLST